MEVENKPVHLGRNAQRIRELVGMKQETLAVKTKLSQQYISKLEQSETFADEILEKLAEGMGVTPDLIRNFNEEKAIYNIQSNFTYHDHASNHQNFQPTIHNAPIDQVVDLFNQLLKSEKEKVELLTKANQAILELSNQIKEMKR